MKNLSLSAPALVLALTSCGPSTTQQTPTGVGPQPTTTSSSGSTANLQNVLEVYPIFDFSGCKAGENCARTFALRVGVDLGERGDAAGPNPRATITQNPDPVWLPEWARLPTSDAGAHFAFEALALAAVHKSFRASCEKAYADYDKDETARMATLDQAIGARNREANPYDRLSGLLSLAPPKPDKSKMNEFSIGSDAVRYRWELAVFQAFEETSRTFVYVFDGYAPSEDLLGVMRPRQQKEYEVDAFCILAAQGKIPGVKALPDTSSWDSGVRSMVRRYVPEERALYIEKRRAELADVTKATFAKARIPNPQLPPGIKELTVPKVTTFVRDGKRATVTSLNIREERVTLASGKVKTIKLEEHASATFEDWPSNVILEPGDAVSFYGAEISAKELTLKGTAELEHTSRTYVLEAKHITKIINKGKTLVYFK